MTHGDKKQKPAKAITKASGKKASAADRTADDSKSKKGGAVAGNKAAARAGTASTKSVAEKPGKRKADSGPADLTFSNPLVGSAFKRAIKKYPVALKRLVD
jgi:hypothetical protein